MQCVGAVGSVEKGLRLPRLTKFYPHIWVISIVMITKKTSQKKIKKEGLFYATNL